MIKENILAFFMHCVVKSSFFYSIGLCPLYANPSSYDEWTSHELDIPQNGIYSLIKNKVNRCLVRYSLRATTTD